jgi:hypothetical protein
MFKTAAKLIHLFEFAKTITKLLIEQEPKAQILKKNEEESKLFRNFAPLFLTK